MNCMFLNNLHACWCSMLCDTLIKNKPTLFIKYLHTIFVPDHRHLHYSAPLCKLLCPVTRSKLLMRFFLMQIEQAMRQQRNWILRASSWSSALTQRGTESGSIVFQERDSTGLCLAMLRPKCCAEEGLMHAPWSSGFQRILNETHLLTLTCWVESEMNHESIPYITVTLTYHES